MMAYNEDIDLPPIQDISNVFATADLLSCSSSDSNKYRRAWLKAKIIRSYILSSKKIPDALTRALSIAPNNTKIASIMAVAGAIFSKKNSNAIT